MAKTSEGPNKSAAIRDYLNKNPNAKPREIVDALSAQGVDVTAQFVSTIKTKFAATGGVTKRRGRPKGTGKKKVGRPKGSVTSRPAAAAAAPAAAAPKKASSGSAYDNLILAKQLADKLGGVANAQAALAALEKLTG